MTLRSINIVFFLLGFLFFVSLTALPSAVAEEGDEGAPVEMADNVEDNGVTEDMADEAATGEIRAMADDDEDDSAPTHKAPSPVPNNILHSGSLSKTIPIEVPPGRNGMTPDVQLQYDSSNKKNGRLGVGWDLNTSFIQRSTKKGLDYNAHDFVYGNQELVAVAVDEASGSGEYRMKIESDFAKFYYEPASGWRILFKDGKVHYLGLTQESRQGDDDNMFRWYLSQIEDSNGNHIDYAYEHDVLNGPVYLTEIRYTLNGATDTGNMVKFINEPSRTDTIPDYTSHFRTIYTQRLQRIETYANNQIVNHYELVYDNGASSGRSRLIRVQRFGADGMTSLPATVFEYTEGGDGQFSSEKATSLAEKTIKAKAFGDFDGDGFNDIVVSGGSRMDGSGGKTWVLYSKGDGGFEDPILIDEISDRRWDFYPLAGDVNGDGLCDVIIISITWDDSTIPADDLEPEEYYEGYPEYQVFFGHDDRTFQAIETQPFTAQGTPISPLIIDLGEIHIGDINGDGLSDLLYTSIYFSSFCTYLSNGSGTFEEHYFNFGTDFYGGKAVAFTDVTDDGRSDLVKLNWDDSSHPSIITRIMVYTGGVNGQLEEPKDTPVTNWTGPPGGGNNPASRYLNYYANIADINGDGFKDIVHYRSNNIIDTYFSKGNGYFEAPYSFTLSGDTLGSLSSGDVNGDGYDDLLRYNSYHNPGTIYLYLSNGNGDFSDVVVASVGASWYPALVDFNGDGRADLHTCSIYHNAGFRGVRPCIDQFYTYLANGSTIPDLLRHIDNGSGYTASITYANSSEYKNKCLPFILHPVKCINEINNVGYAYSTHYSYENGHYNYTDREFRGFGTVIERLDNNAIRTTYYNNDAFRKGKAYCIDLSQFPTGELLSRKTMQWQPIDEGASWGFVRLNQERHEIFSPDNNVYSQRDYIYDENSGNLLSTDISGSNAEKISIQNQYANYGTWLWRKTHEVISGEVSGVAREKEFGYDSANGNLLYEDSYLNGAPYERISYAYDEYGNRIHEYDANGNPPTQYEYDATGTYPIKITNPKGHVINKEWDYRFGKELWVQDPNGQRTSNTYDYFGRLLTTDFPDGGQTRVTYFDYGAGGLPSDADLPRKVLTENKASDSEIITSLTYYDGLGRKLQTVEGAENGQFVVNKIYYDEMGRVVFEAGPFAQSSDAFLDWNKFTNDGYGVYTGFDYPYVETTYDPLDRPLTKTSRDEQGGLATTYFNYSGYATTITDPDQCIKREIRDHLDRIIEVVEDPGVEDCHTSYQYNAAGDLTEVRNALWTAEAPDNNRLINAYDTLGRKISMDDPDLGTWQYAYDANGNLTQQIDANGNSTQFSYDALNRLVTKVPDTGGPTVTHTYDSGETPFCIGRLHSTTNGDVTTTVNAYDAMGRQLEVSKSIAGTTARTMNWTYDLAGRVQRLTYPYAGSPGYHVDYAYHPNSNWLQSATDSNGTVIAQMSGYQPSGKIGTLTFGNGVTTQYAYNGWSQRLTGYQSHSPSGDILQDRQYTYSPAGDVTYIDDLAWVETYYYTYDKLHRLISETTSAGSAGIIPGIFEMSYNDLDHLHAVSEVSTNGQILAYDYDANGNLINGPDLTDPNSISQRTLSFNTDNMPTRIVHSNGGTTNITYDGEAKRAKKSATTGGTTYYFSDEFELHGKTETAYVFAGNLRVAMVENGETVKYFHKDHLGSSSVITDAAGSSLERTRYMPYGGQRGEGSGLTETAYGFTDQELDKEIGLYNYGARLYDPIAAGFVSPDVVVSNWYDPQLLNRYGYTRDPLKYVDPDGHSFVLAVLVGAGFAYLADAYLTPDISNAPVDASTPLGDTSALAHAGSLLSGASVGVTTVTAGLKAGAQEVLDEALDYATGGASSLTKVTTGPGWYCDAPKKAVHGNSKLSTKPQHGYEIYNKNTGDVVKTGISGSPLNKNGTSRRANIQVNKLNKAEGEDIYGAKVVEKDMSNRQTALDWESQNSQKLWDEGHSMDIHRRPRPWEEW